MVISCVSFFLFSKAGKFKTSMAWVPYNKLLTNLASSSCTGEYWPSVVFVQTLGQYSPVQPSRSVSKRLMQNATVREYLDGWPNTNTPGCNIGGNSFSFFFPCLYKVILKTAELLVSCINVISSTCIYQLFAPRFAMSVFTCIKLQYWVNKQQKMLFEFSSIPLTVGRLKHLIMAWIMQKYMYIELKWWTKFLGTLEQLHWFSVFSKQSFKKALIRFKLRCFTPPPPNTMLKL